MASAAHSKAATLTRAEEHWIGRFRAMASPCEVLIESGDEPEARRILDIAAAEAGRIEAKLSRYLRGNIVDRINNANGAPVEVDGETAQLLDFAEHVYRVSEGRFDITSGVLRKAWQFDGGGRVPTRAAIDALLEMVGWQKIRWRSPILTLRPGMQIDFGGIGKEYAVDRACQLVAAQSDASCLINFGGDLAVTRPRRDGAPWRVGIEVAERAGRYGRVVLLRQGGLATSGDSKRYVIHDGVRYGHILDARTGWPIASRVHTVTVAADTCTEAGMIATLAMLQADRAETFLEELDVKHWIDCEPIRPERGSAIAV